MEREVRLDAGVLAEYPDAQVRFVVAYGLRNGEEWSRAAIALAELERDVVSGRWTPFTKDQPRIMSWHAAYRKFGTNPNRMRPSVDALSRRLTRDGRLPRINPAVDAYNLVSVKHGTPAGAFDLDAISGVEIRFARPGDAFVPLGEPDVVEAPSNGEVVYAQGNRVLTRHWNYRDADHTKVAGGAKNVVFMIERVSAAAMPDADIAAAQEELAGFVAPNADRVVWAVIDGERPRTVL